MQRLISVLAMSGLVLAYPGVAAASPALGPETLVEANSLPIQVIQYSVPQFVDWNADGRPDLLVGEKSAYDTGKVRVYLNSSIDDFPIFTDFDYVQSSGSDLTVPASGCLGAFSRALFWDGDDKIDLLIGRADGFLELFLNEGTASEPAFGSGTLLQVGPPGSKVDINVGNRACPAIVDWDNDGAKDLVVGEYNGLFHLFINEGTNTQPDFWLETFVQEDGDNLIVESLRSSPTIVDWDADGRKDIITGDTLGRLRFYSNVWTDDDPAFSGYELLESLGVIIDLPNDARSRPYACDWTGDGLGDLLVGGADGYVRLYQGVPEPATIGMLLAVGGGLVLQRRRRR